MVGFNLNVGLLEFVLIIIGLIVLFFAVNFLFYFLARKRTKTSKANIGIINISGILKYGTGGRSGFQKIISQIEIAAKMNPKALIVRINSPGGTMGASHEIYEALKVLKKKGIKIVALMEDLAASGGYYVAMPADWIVATPGAMTGSIGVIVKHVDISKVLDRFGVVVNDIKAGENKNMLSLTSPMTENAEALMQKSVNECREAFFSIVAEGRGLTLEYVRKIADGRVMTAQEAKELKLIDELGGYHVALQAAMQLAQIPEGKESVSVIEPPVSIFERIGLVAQMGRIFNNLENITSASELSDLPLYLMKR